MNRRSALKTAGVMIAALFAPVAAFAGKRRKPRLLEIPLFPLSSRFAEISKVEKIEPDEGLSVLAHRKKLTFDEHRRYVVRGTKIDPRELVVSHVYLSGWEDWRHRRYSKASIFHCANPKIIDSTARAEDLVAEYERLRKEAE